MARKGLNIYYRKDGRWEGRFVKDRREGKTRFGYVYGKSYQETREKLAAARSLWNAGFKETRNVVVRLDAISEDWLADSEAQLKASTIAKYRDYLRCYVHPAFGDRAMSAISSDDVSEFCSKLLTQGGKKGTGLSPKTVAEVFRVMKHLREYAISRQYAVGYSSDCVHIKQKRHDLRVFTPAERECLQQYLEKSDDLSHMGILLCNSTGMRIGELCALTWDDISLGDGMLHIRRTLQRISSDDPDGAKTKVIITTPKSACSQRAVPLPKGLCARFEALRKPGAFFLTGEKDRYVEPRTMQNHFKSILSVCNIQDANFHALRHTFATVWVEHGFDVKCLSAILGHSDVSITLNRYVHPSMDAKRENMEHMASILL